MTDQRSKYSIYRNYNQTGFSFASL